MNNEMLEYVNAAGLPELHTKFLTQFLAVDTPTPQVVVIPTGGGKGRFLLAIARFVASQGGRVLLLTDRVVIQEQYHYRLRQENAITINLDRPTMRGLQAGVTIPRIQWQRGCIYTATIQFVGAEDIKPQILQTTWDLIIIDDARSTKILAELSSSSAYKRLLIVVSVLNSEDKSGKFRGFDIHILGTMNLDLQPKFELEIVEFGRTKSELKLLQEVLLLTKQLSDISNLDQDLRSKSIRQRAASSFYALELVLAGLRQNIRDQRNFAAHNPDADGANYIRLVSILELLDNLLIQLDEIEADSKQQALLHLRNQLSSAIVYTNSSDTAGYLSESLNRESSNSLRISGSIDFNDKSSFNEFIKSGGIVFVSDIGRLTGYDFRSVLSAVVLYDLPQSDIELFQVVSRINPQKGKVFFLKDTSNVLGDSQKTLQGLLEKLGLGKK